MQITRSSIETQKGLMVHLAIQQHDESGSAVTWGEHVTAGLR
jgi:hypothetical protein